MQRFDGRSVLVTGGASGLGQACVRRLADEGACVAIADRNLPAAKELAAELDSKGIRVIYTEVNITEGSDVRRMIDTVLADFGRIDGAVNCAGVAPEPMTFDSYDEDVWDQTHAVNLRGTFLCTKHELSIMVGQGSGSIVNVASVAGLLATGRGLGAYVSSKHAVVGLSRAAAYDTAHLGVRVNVVCPGAMDTPMLQRAVARHPDIAERHAATIPMGRISSPTEIAGAVAFLLSDDASFITGQTVVADGGVSIC